MGKKDVEHMRTLLHDLRASHHAANLNAQAAGMLVQKINAAEAEKAAKMISTLQNDLKKFKAQLEELSSVIKSNF